MGRGGWGEGPASLTTTIGTCLFCLTYPNATRMLSVCVFTPLCDCKMRSRESLPQNATYLHTQCCWVCRVCVVKICPKSKLWCISMVSSVLVTVFQGNILYGQCFRCVGQALKSRSVTVTLLTLGPCGQQQFTDGSGAGLLGSVLSTSQHWGNALAAQFNSSVVVQY